VAERGVLGTDSPGLGGRYLLACRGRDIGLALTLHRSVKLFLGDKVLIYFAEAGGAQGGENEVGSVGGGAESVGAAGRRVEGRVVVGRGEVVVVKSHVESNLYLSSL
jgi:hypothetical protein